MLRAKMSVLSLGLMLLLAGCGVAPDGVSVLPQLKLVAMEVPPDLLRCPETVDVPEPPYTDEVRAKVVVDLGAAWEECSTKLAAVRRYVAERPLPP